MRLYARPSKTFFFNMLARKLSGFSKGIALDAASANFKNRRLFETEGYVGVDLDAEAVKEGLKKYPDQRNVGIVGDMNALGALPAGSFSLVVSTNTLDHLHAREIEPAIAALARLTSSDGMLFLQLSLPNLGDNTVSALKRTFKSVRVRYYRNKLSNLYEKIFERDGELAYHPIASSRPFLALSFLLSRLEYLTGFFPRLNMQAFIICTGKPPHQSTGANWCGGEKGADGTFDTSKLQKIGNRLYKI